jgi:hypothetical protein
MLEIFQYFVSILTNDATLNAIVSTKNIFTGPADILQQQSANLLAPAILLSQVSEAVRSNPPNTRDTQIQLDILSRNSQLEIENIYERILVLLDYNIANQNTAHIFWQRLGGAVDTPDSERRTFRRSVTFTVWSSKP